MKLTNKIALISGLGCLALVGTGFAAWTYADTTNIKNADDIANAVSGAGTGVNTDTSTINVSGTISVANKAYLYCDELYTISSGKLVASISGGKIQGIALWAGAATAADAIEDSNTNANKVLVDASLVPTLTMSDGSDVPSYFKYTWSYSVPTGISKYVTFTDPADMTWTSGQAITLPSISFNQSVAPQSKTAYTTMANELAAAKITFTFTVANA